MRIVWLTIVVLASWLGSSSPSLAQPNAGKARTIEARLASAPHAPGDAPDVIVHVPPGYDPRQPLDLLVFFHGFDGCARALLAPKPTPCRSGEPAHPAWDLAGLHSAAGTNAILLIPQLAFHARTSRAHRFMQHGRFDEMVSELLQGELRSVVGQKSVDDVRSVTLIAHSGGYHATVAIIGEPTRKTRVDRVVLLDALYAGWNVLARWANAEPERRLISLYTGQRQTVRGNQRLLASLPRGSVSENLGEGLLEAMRQNSHVVAQVRTKHADMPRAHLTAVLRGLSFAAP